MLDGRIDTQGTVKELQTRNFLTGIEFDAAAIAETVANLELPNTAEVPKKPGKLINEEHREIGGVNWSRFRSYLKASWVP